jgi:L-threonylcarbamoyladenylate synthase
MNAKIGSDIGLARKILTDGGVVAIPTETVYGLAANALNHEAVLKIFEIKNRPSFDPLIVHIGSTEQLATVTTSSDALVKELTSAFWPGPLTIVLPKKETIPDLVTSGLETVGVRMPSHPLTLELLQSLEFPLAAPSANPFGYISPTTAQHVADQLGNKVDYILDGGPAKVGVESTIISLVGPVPKILRWGGLESEEITKVTGPIEASVQSTDNPSAPGMLSSHYAPRKKLILGNLDELSENHASEKVSILSFRKKYEGHGEVLSNAGNLHEAAQNLFSSLRRLDSADTELILAELVPDEGLGRAINDRLRRAAN